MIRKRFIVLNTMSAVSFVTLALLSFGYVGFLVNTGQRYLSNITYRKDTILSIYALAGYGGGIHAFKNLVLRRDLKYYDPARDSLGEAITKVDGYLAISDLTETENYALRTIRKTLSKYRQNTELAKSLILAGKSSDEIDIAVRVDDAPTIVQMKALSLEHSRLMHVTYEKLSMGIMNVALAFGGVCLLFFGATFSYSLYFSKRAARSIGYLEKVSKRIAGGDFQDPIHLRPEDDLNILADAMEKMRLSLNETLQLLRGTIVDLERFSFAASHDLQEPLRKISVIAEMLHHDIAETASPRDIVNLGILKSAALRMSALVSGLLEYSRFGHENPEVIDLNTVVQNILDDFSMMIAAAGAKIIVQQLPAVKAGKAEMRQLFQNLISNAIKFRREGVQVEIRIWAEMQGANRCRFFVADNGIGIEPQYFTRIFQPFERLNKASQYPGSGLGLSMCKQIVKRHEGDIEVTANTGGGSLFVFDLPTIVG